MNLKLTKIFKLSFLFMLSWFVTGGWFNTEALSEAVQEEQIMQRFEIDQTGSLIKYDGNCKDVVIPDEVKSISFGAFIEHDEIETVKFHEGLLTIDECAFYGCSRLKELDLPNSLVHIGRLAFGNCVSLDKIKIGDNLSEIMELFVCGCVNLSDIEVSDNNVNFASVGKILYDKDMKSLVLCPQKMSGIVRVPDSVVTIKEHSFLDCDGIEEVIIGNNVKYIDEAAFYGCSNLKRVQMNAELKKIRSYAFAKCTSLEKIKLGPEINYIGNGAFFECDNLIELVCLSQNMEFGEDVFDKGLDLTIYAPRSSSVKTYAEEHRYNFERL